MKKVEEENKTLKNSDLKRKVKEGTSQIKFTKLGCEKQYKFNCEVLTVVGEEYRRALEEHFDEIPENLKAAIKKGEDLLKQRNRHVRIADEVGWDGLEKFEKEELAENAEEEKKLKSIRKEKREKEEKRKRGNARSGYSHRTFGSGRRDARDRPSYREEERYDITIKDNHNTKETFDNADKERKEAVSSVKSSDTMPVTVSRETETAEEEEEEEAQETEETNDKAVNSSEILKDDINDEDNYSRDLKAAKRLAKFEGELELQADGEEEEGIEVFTEGQDIDLKVHDTLNRHVSKWEAIQANNFCLGVIKEGYKMSFVDGKEPNDYREKNNKSFIKNKDFGLDAVDKLVKNKIVQEVDRDKLKCVNPLSVAEKSGKKRLVIDLSRQVNQHTKAPKFRIESTREFLQVVKKGQWMFKFDLKSAYHQVPIHSEHQKYLGFCVVREGVEHFYKFLNLPFGFNDACRVLTKILRFPLQCWREQQIPSFIHVDDGVGLASSEKDCRKAAEVVKRDLEELGLLVSPEKCEWVPSQEIEWTGFIINTKTFDVKIPEDKVKKAERKVEEILRSPNQVPVKTLASFTGLIISFSPGIGRTTRFRTRFMTMEIARTAEEQGWKASISLSLEVLKELNFWKQNLRSLNGFPIRTGAGVQVVRQRPSKYYSDAGGHMMGGGQIENKVVYNETVFKYSMTTEEKAKSSTWRELRGVEEGLKTLAERLKEKRVRWHNDNWAACKIIEIGSMKRDCHEVAVRIDELVKKWKIEFEVVWQRRETEEIRFADRMSKDFDFGDYRVSQEDFDDWKMRYGPFTADFFASDYSKRMIPFHSRYLSEHSSGSDAFAADWTVGQGYFHPPVGLVPRVLSKAEESRAQGILVVPDWPGSWMMTEVKEYIKAGKIKLLERSRPELECPEWFENRTFLGRPKFDMLVFQLTF